MKKKVTISICIILVILLLIFGIVYLIDLNRMKHNEPVLFSTWGYDYAPPVGKYGQKFNSNMSIVLSLEDEITGDTAWCGTFNLIWNDLKNDLAKQDIVFTPQPQIVTNLNKGTFNSSYLSEDSYYKVYGHPSLELKKQIEKAIKEKFNETSSILDDFDWENRDPLDYFLYAMLKKNFEFPQEFTKLENGNFGSYKNVKYFGINVKTAESVRNQVEVLYYNSDKEFAIKLKTKENDEVILAKGLNEKTFGESYNKVLENNKKESYTSLYNPSLAPNEYVKIPVISFKLKKRITEVENQNFYFSNGVEYKIEQAMQTIEFDLDAKGGRVKSEAGMMVNKEAIMEDRIAPRIFNFDDTFTIFLKEKDKDLPYFAAKISDISKVQNGVEK